MFPIETLIRDHLQNGIYPPINPAFAPMAIRAVQLVNEGDEDVLVAAPGDRQATARSVIEAMRLERFIGDDDDRY